jgi:hypothetical protein
VPLDAEEGRIRVFFACIPTGFVPKNVVRLTQYKEPDGSEKISIRPATQTMPMTMALESITDKRE